MSTARRAAWIAIATAMLAVAVGRAGAGQADGRERPTSYVLAQSAAAETSSAVRDSSADRNHYPESGAVLLLLIAATVGLRRSRWHWRQL
ncbi:MAG: hypothetical protein IT441_04145 [Phycisphaeraceae bacterium]|nr:hypothetical protein [Phycisphaeraceae bacterium]